MKVFTLANQKGGVGKSAVATQFSYFCVDKRLLRVLFIDGDHQGNSSKAIAKSGFFDIASFTAADIFEGNVGIVTGGGSVLVKSSPELAKLEKFGEKHNSYATNLNAFLDSVSGMFDLCIIDTNPNPDIRLTAALVLSDFVLSPIVLNQEAIDGIGALSQNIANIRAKMNNKLHMIGLLPNIVENKPFQQNNLKEIIKNYPSLLMKMGNAKFALIPNRTAIPEAQANGEPIWKSKKSSSRQATKDILPVFERLCEVMDLQGEVQ
ncbi:MAG: ParA family protein [Cellvibrionaceae bacterium]